MADTHNPDSHKPEDDSRKRPPETPADDFVDDLILEEEGDIVFDLADEDSPPLQTLNLSEVPEEAPLPSTLPPGAEFMDEPQSMLFEPEEVAFDSVAEVADEGMVAFDLPDANEDDLGFAKAPAAEDADADGMIGFDLPEPSEDADEVGTRTQGVSREDLDFLVAEAMANPKAPESFTAPEAEAPAEVLITGEIEAVDFGEDVPEAASASAVGSEPMDIVDFGEDVPEAASASAVGSEMLEEVNFGDDVPVAESASFAGMASGVAVLGEDVPQAESASSVGAVPQAESLEPPPMEPFTVAESPMWGEAVAGAPSTKSDIDLGNAIEPVKPGSSWFRTPKSEGADVASEVPPPPAAMHGDDEDIFDVAQIPVAEGSDIFGWKPRNYEAAAESEVPEAEPVKPTPSALIRESAAQSSRHKGVTTPIDDESDIGATPRASDGASSILNELGGPLATKIDGSEVLLNNPGVERTISDSDAIEEFEVAALPRFEPDDPAIEVLADTPDDATTPELAFDELAAAGGGSQVPVADAPLPSSGEALPEWFSSPGSDIFAGRRPPSDSIEDSGRVNPFASDDEAEDPSLSSAPSSIFTGSSVPDGSHHGGSASVRIGNNEEEQTLFNELSDDDQASNLFGAMADDGKRPSDSTQEDEQEGQIDWLASDPAEVDSAMQEMRAPASGIFSKTDLPPVSAAPSSIFSKTNLDPAGDRELEATQAMDSKGNIVEDLYGDLPPLPASASKSGTMAPLPAPAEVEVNWLAGTDEPESLRSEPAPTFAMMGDDSTQSRGLIDDNSDVDSTDERPMPARQPRPREKASGGGMLVGGIAGMLGGLAIGAGAYFGNIVPNSEKQEDLTPVVQKLKDEGLTKDKRLAQVNAERDKAVEDKKFLEGERDRFQGAAEKAGQDLARVNGDLDGFKIAATMAEERAKTLEKDLATAKTEVKTADQASKDALAKVAGLEKAATDAMTKATDFEKMAKEAATKAADFEKAATDAKAAADTLAGITKNLQDSKLLPADAADPAAIAKAVKDTIEKAAKPGMPAGAITAEEAKTLKEMLMKSEAAAKAAADKLEVDTAKLKTDYVAQMDTLKKTHADEIKKLTDGSPDLKKLQEAADAALKKAQDEATTKLNTETAKLRTDYTAQMDMLKKSHADEIKKISDGSPDVKKIQEAADAALKKAKDEATARLDAETAKLRTDYTAQIDTLKKTHADEIKKLSDGAPDIKKFQETAAAELKKVQDAFAQAQQAADKKSQDEMAKLKADYETRLAAAIKGNGGDPVIAHRTPVEPNPKGLAVANRLLDDSVRLYKARDFTQAESLLTQSIANDPSNPIAWYFLGATRWQSGRQDAAKQDFRQGAEREALRAMSASAVANAISVIQGPVRAAITDARP